MEFTATGNRCLRHKGLTMNVREPTLGPIVGATETHSCRILIRGERPQKARDESTGKKTFRQAADEATPYQPPRALGVCRWRAQGGTFSPPLFFHLNANFDHTGLALLFGLKPSTLYTYQAGWLETSEDQQVHSDIAPHELCWSGVKTHSFTTASADASAPRSFVFGSCRYLLKLWGAKIFDDRGDKTFRSILDVTDDGALIDMFLMLGDQIYADDLRCFFPDKTMRDYLERYRDAFGQPHIRALMARVPTYMTLDDHEIKDGWPATAKASDRQVLLPNALGAYRIYQASHSPLLEIKNGRPNGFPNHYWYSFSNGCADVFMMDTRTERDLPQPCCDGSHPPEGQQDRQTARGEERHSIISSDQMDELEAWLANDTGRIKFIATTVPFVCAEGPDKWDGFRAQRDHILDFIFTNKIRRVVFLSGDVHTSFSCEIRSDRDADFKVISIVSSAFYWPYPHQLLHAFQLSGPLAGYSQNQYTITQASPTHATDNFTRVKADLRGLEVDVFSRKGDRLGSSRYDF